MTLVVHTARVTYSGPDRLDIARSTGVTGAVFAPSWTILLPVLKLRRQEGPAAVAYVWPAYAANYLAEMRKSYLDYRASWERLLESDMVTLVCYCMDPEHCHRTLLAGILGKLGADVRGERDLGERR